MNFGMIKTACVSPQLRVADVAFNQTQLMHVVDTAAARGVKVLVTPELSLTGYTCADLFLGNALLEAADSALAELARGTRGKGMLAFFGVPVRRDGALYNCAAAVYDGRIVCVIPKTYLANYTEFYEKRWFSSGAGVQGAVHIAGQTVPFGNFVIRFGGVKIGVEICEDLWVPVPPSSRQALFGAELLCNLSASNEVATKADYRRALIQNQSARCLGAYLYAGACAHESTTDLLYSGACLICENGAVLAESKRFSQQTEMVFADVDVQKLQNERVRNKSFADNARLTDSSDLREITIDCPPVLSDCMTDRFVDAYPFVPSDGDDRRERCGEIFSIQAAGLAKRLRHVGSTGCVVGISGGLDSTLALLVCVQAMKLLGRDSSDILGVTMPGFGTTDRTYENALELMRTLGVTIREIPIRDACLQHFKDIGHDPDNHDITYENTQARERTQILFDLANKENKLLVGTGDLSELAMGWCTYNADHMSMYGVNASVPKTLVRYLVQYVADASGEACRAVLTDILNTPVSPELLPPEADGTIAQKTEEQIGPYELHDFFLYYFVRFGFAPDKILALAEKAFAGQYSRPVLRKWLGVFVRRFFNNQFKRSCVPDSPKVGTVSLSPRGDWRMPSDACAAAYLAFLD